MPHTRPCRIVRRAVMVLAVAVLLLSGYVGSLCVVCFADGADALSDVPDFPMALAHAYVAPVDWYIDSDLPGSEPCLVLLDKCYDAGWWLADH